MRGIMKSKGAILVKNIISVLSSMMKEKLMGVKSKADAVRVRLLVFSLLKTRKLSLGSLSNKIQSLLDRKGNHDDHDNHQVAPEAEGDDDIIDQSKAIVLYDGEFDENNNDKYPDLTHSLFEEEEEEEQRGSVIDIVKNSRENEGEDFKLEDEIDHVADLFIKRFRKQMRLEKLESFKRLQEMLGRGV